MKIGINMLLWSMTITREFLPQFKMLKNAGADGVEIPIMGGDSGDYRELGRALRDLDLGVTCVTVFSGEDDSPVSPDPRVRRRAIEKLRRDLENASKLGASVLCGPMYQPLGWFSGAGPTVEEKERAAEVLRAVAGQALDAGILLAVEPLNRFEAYLLNTLADAADFVSRVNHPSVGVLYDTFHANIEERNPAQSIRRYGKAIRHFHVSASDRGTPGHDHVDWQGTFGALREVGYDDWLVLEAFGRAMPDLAAATRVWRDLFISSERAALDTIAFIRETWHSLAD